MLYDSLRQKVVTTQKVNSQKDVKVYILTFTHKVSHTKISCTQMYTHSQIHIENHTQKRSQEHINVHNFPK